MSGSSNSVTIQSLSKLLKEFELKHDLLINDPEILINGLGSFENLSRNFIGYYTGSSFAAPIDIDDRTLVISSEFNTENYKRTNFIICDDPKSAFYILAQEFNKRKFEPGIHPTVVIGENVTIDPSAYIGPFVILEDNITIGRNTIILGNSYFYSNTWIGDEVVIEANSSIGATGVFWTWDSNGNSWDLPQLGGVIIEDKCFIGTDVTIVRAAFENNFTRIGKQTRIAHGSKIGHDTQLGEHVHLANNVSIGGGAHLGARSFAGSGVILKAGVKIAEDTVLGAGCVVIKPVVEPKQTFVGNPAQQIQMKDKPSGMHAPLYKVLKNKK